MKFIAAARILRAAVESVLAGGMPCKKQGKSGCIVAEGLEARRLLSSVLYDNNFSNGVGGGTIADGVSATWSSISTTTAPNGDQFAGQFGKRNVSLNLSNLGAHTEVTVSFDLYLVRSWDGTSTYGGFGPDTWGFSIDGVSRLDATFSNKFSHYNIPVSQPQSFASQSSVGGSNAAGTGASATGSLGYSFQNRAGMDSVYHFSYTIDHTSPNLGLLFRGSPNQDVNDESWGLDNVRVEAVPVELDSLTVKDPANPTNSVTASGESSSGDPTLYVEQNADNKATIDISGLVTPNSAFAKAKTLWRIDEPYAYQSQGNFTSASNSVELTVIDNNRDWTVRAGIDTNGNGLLDAVEVRRAVKITVVRIDTVSVEDVAVRGHKAVAQSTAVPTYLAMPNSSGKVELELDAFGSPESTAAGKHILWNIWNPDTAEPAHSGTFDTNKPTATLSPGSTRPSRAFGLEVGFDDDADGKLHEREVSHRIAMTVVFPLVLQATTFIPYEAVADPTPLVQPVMPDEPFGDVLFHAMLFGGDARVNAAGTASTFDRDATRFRTRQKLTLIPVLVYDRDGTVDGLDTAGIQNLIGLSKHYHTATSISGTPNFAGGVNLTAAAKNDTATGDLNMLHATATASAAGMKVTTTLFNGLLASVTLDMAASNPLETGSPDIDYDAVLKLSYSNPNSPSFHLTGSHDGFPSYDFFLDDQLIYSHDCIATGQTPGSLFPNQEYSIDKRGSLVPA